MANYLNTRRLSALFTLILFVLPLQAEQVVIVNAGLTVERLTHEEVVNIFMGRYRKLPDGSALQPLDMKGDTPERRGFYKKLLDKSLAEIDAYWARLIFSGRTLPPAALDADDEILQRVARDPSAVGYVDSSKLNNRVKAVYTLPEDEGK